jgi:outer membrane protein assembly factor BamE (lipoprotein component of BamABCDE complex)
MTYSAKKPPLKQLVYTLPICLSLVGCMSAAQHQQDLADTHERALTLGVVQKQVLAGTSQAQVATVLGSPNIVTRDNNNQETWIYDKIASEASFSQDFGGAQGSISGQGGLGNNTGFGFPGTLNGSLGGSYNKQSGAASITQRSLTVIVKFNAKNVVDNVSYHSSKF